MADTLQAGSPRRSPLQILAVFVISLYQNLLSGHLGRKCRFFPSCSQYAKVAIERHGVVRGGMLGLRRLGRCHPFRPGGIDPVPEAKVR